MAEMMDGIWELVEVLKSTPETPRANTTYATVTRVDKEGTVWVHIPGGAEETPANGLNVATVEPGDVVGISIAGNQANVTGNATAPAVSQREVVRAVEPVAKQAEQSAKVAEQAEVAAQEAATVASKTNEHFWTDGQGVHVTEVTQEEFLDTPQGANQLSNSSGLLLRDGETNLAQFTPSLASFYDGQGNAASNVVASFGAAGATIGKSSGANINIGASEISMAGVNGNNALTISTTSTITTIESEQYSLMIEAALSSENSASLLLDGEDGNVRMFGKRAEINADSRIELTTDIVDLQPRDSVLINSSTPIVIERKNVTVSSTSAGSNYSSNAIDVSKNGYTPAGVLQTWWSSGSGQNKFNDYGTHIEGNNLYVRLWNAGTSAASGTLVCSILYICNELL